MFIETDYTWLKDEELLLRFRLGDGVARNELSLRYFRSRHFHLLRACPEYADLLDDWTYNEVFFRSYLMAEGTYRIGEWRFIAYFQFILHREAGREAKKILQERENIPCFSLDAIDPDTNDSYLHELIPDNQPLNDPKAFCAYADALSKLGKLPRHLKPADIEVVRRLSEGYSIQEVSEQMDLRPSNTRMMAYRFRKWAKTVLKSLNEASEGERLLLKFQTS